MNKFIALGRVSNDVEVRHSTNGKTVVRFNFAVRKSFKKDNEPDADFFKCVVFGKLAEFFERANVSKGAKLLLEGEMRNDNYEKDGVKHYGMQFVVNSMEFCESKNESNNASGSTPTYAPIPADFEEIDAGEDLPF